MIVENVKKVGNLSDAKTQSRTVYDADGISPTLCSGMDHGNTMPHIIDKQIVAMRGRNPDNPSDRTVGSPTEQRLEPNSQGICNTLTSVQKDNMVMETVRMDEGRENEERDTVKALQILRKEIGEENFFKWSVGGLRCILQEAILRQNVYAKRIYEDWKNRSELFQCTYNSKRNKSVDATEEDLRNMWEEWSIRCSSYGRGLSEQRAKQLDDFVQKLPHETTSQKRFVYCVWKASEGIQLLRETLSEVQKIWESDDNEQGTRTHYRIRKLTPKSCWRLMDFSDEDFHKAESVNSNTQLYKQAGNSIVKNVLVAIFGQMLPGKEDVYRGN